MAGPCAYSQNPDTGPMREPRRRVSGAIVSFGAVIEVLLWFIDLSKCISV